MKKKTAKNPDGTMKTINQLVRQTMTVLQYGKYLAQQGGQA